MKTNPEIMRYTKNSSSYWLCMLALVADIVYFTAAFSPLMGNVSVTIGYMVALDVIINIVFLLFAFLTAEKQKTYAIEWSIIGIVMGVIQIVRIFILPFMTYEVIMDGNPVIKEFITGGVRAQCIIGLVVSAVALLGASFIAYVKSKSLKAYLKEVEGGK